MDLRLEKVDQTDAAQLVQYCALHGPEHDDSFLPGRDFPLTPENPAYLLWKGESMVGGVVLMRTRQFRSAHRGRFSIFHSSLNTREAYAALLDAIGPHFHDLQAVYLFLPVEKRETAAILVELGFAIERTSFVLERNDPTVGSVEIPRGYAVHPLVPSDQPGIRQFAECLNQSYRQLAGHTDVTPQDIRSWFDAASYLDGGICLLRRNEEPVGTLRVTREDEGRNSGEVSALGIVDGHRGQGLGRALLRYAVAFALKNGLGPLSLSVHADNEAAITLYRSEGFALTTTMVCYALACRQANSRSEV